MEDFKKLFRPFEDTEASTLEPSPDVSYFQVVDAALREEARDIEESESSAES